jgi:hypothetical protein
MEKDLLPGRPDEVFTTVDTSDRAILVFYFGAR